MLAHCNVRRHTPVLWSGEWQNSNQAHICWHVKKLVLHSASSVVCERWKSLNTWTLESACRWVGMLLRNYTLESPQVTLSSSGALLLPFCQRHCPLDSTAFLFLPFLESCPEHLPIVVNWFMLWSAWLFVLIPFLVALFVWQLLPLWRRVISSSAYFCIAAMTI